MDRSSTLLYLAALTVQPCQPHSSQGAGSLALTPGPPYFDHKPLYIHFYQYAVVLAREQDE